MDELIIAGRRFKSRLMVGTGKFASNAAMVAAMEGSGSEIVTVALRRVDIDNPGDSLLQHIDREKYLLLPNTSGARDADEAVRLARLARAAGCEPWVKLEVTPDPYYLLPDPIETLKAAEILVKEGFTVLPYINADPSMPALAPPPMQRWPWRWAPMRSWSTRRWPSPPIPEPWAQPLKRVSKQAARPTWPGWANNAIRPRRPAP